MLALRKQEAQYVDLGRRAEDHGSCGFVGVVIKCGRVRLSKFRTLFGCLTEFSLLPWTWAGGTTQMHPNISQHLPALFQHLPASPTIPPNSRAIHVGPLSHLIIVFDSVGMSSSLRARTSPNRQLVKGSDVPIQNLGPPTTTHARRDPRQTIAPKNTNWADANQRAPQSNSSLTRLGSGLLGAEDPGPSISSRLQPHMDRLGSALR